MTNGILSKKCDMDDLKLRKEIELGCSTYYVKLLHEVPYLIDKCCSLINKEWKRSQTARLRSIEGSSENFPMSLILLKNYKNPEVVGHCKISRLSLSKTKVFLETVVIHPCLRGQGLGKFLMCEAEEVCRRKDIKWIYLATKGQEGFYEKLGYVKCPPVSTYGCQFIDSDEEGNETKEEIKTVTTSAVNNSNIKIPSPPPLLETFLKTYTTNVTSAKTFMRKEITYKLEAMRRNDVFECLNKRGTRHIAAKTMEKKVKMKDYTSNNYCDLLWVSDLLGLKKDAKNVFSLELKKFGKTSKVTINHVTIFGTIVEVKQVKNKEFLYHLDDGTGVIACKHREEQFEEIISLIENESVDVINQTLDLSSVTDASADDSIFNDRSIQLEEINFNKKCRLKSLQSIWDDIYKSFSSLIEPYKVGDPVIIQGKLYTYFNLNQIYINNIRTLNTAEEIILLTIKLEDGLDCSKETDNSKAQDKRLSGLLTFDNVPHLDVKASNSRNIETPELKNELLNLTPEVLTPNLKPVITFDTFMSST